MNTDKKTILIVGHAPSESGSLLRALIAAGERGWDSMPPVQVEFANTESTEMLVAFENEISIGEDGWAQIAPFGDFPGMAVIADGNGGFKRVKAIQRMDRQAVTQMVNEFTSSRRGVKKFLKGCPIFLGHPDMPGGAAKYPDAEPKGVFANIAMRDKGLYGEPILTDAGEQLVATKRVKAFSGRWEAAQYLGEETINGTKFKVFRPTRFLSAGLTDRPNLPVELFNEAEETSNQTKKDTMKKEAVIALLMGLGVSGITIANEATDEQVSEALKQIGEKAKTATKLEGEKVTLANEKTTLANEVQAARATNATLEGKVTTLTTEKTTLSTERDTARTNFANERKARIGETLAAGLKDGRITAAEKATWETRLGNEASFANELEAFNQLTAKVKTTSITLQRGDRKVEISNASERREMVAELVNERMGEVKCDYDAAFAFVQKNHPTLFGAMDAPEIRKGGPKRA